jgi:cytochrome c oxidase subunit 4
MNLTPRLVRHYVITWVGLLVLLAITCGTAYIPLGPFNLVINLAVAVAKALLVVFVFMHVLRGVPMIRLVALAGLLWLSLLVGISLVDLVVRGG